MPTSRRHPGDGAHFRVVVYAVEGGREKIIMEGTGTAHHAAVGYDDGSEYLITHSVGGSEEVLRCIADLIADNPVG
jgi:hypothetical protein